MPIRDDFWATPPLEPLPPELVKKEFGRNLHGWGWHGTEVIDTLKRQHWIYFLQGDDGGPIKIGRTCKLRWRCSEWNAGYPFGTLHYVGLILGVGQVERDLHRRFKHLNIKFEWFRPAQELLDFVRSLPREW